MMDGLGLKGLRLVGIRTPQSPECDDSQCIRQVEVEPIFSPSICPGCGSAKLYRHGIRLQCYADVPHLGEPAQLLVHRRRWRCTECQTLFPDPLPDMDDKRRATRRLIEYVGKRSMIHTFSEVGRDVGLSDVSIRHIFDDMVADLERRYRFETPAILGIDELKIIGQYRCILTNVGRNTVYDILPSRKMDHLRRYFRGFENPKDVQCFVADFWWNYAMIAREFFPHAKFVVDRFHIQRMGSTSLEAVRKKYRKSLTARDRIALKDDRFLLLKHGASLGDRAREELERVFRQHPDLKAAWLCKEQFHAIWQADSRDEADVRIDRWLRSVPDGLRLPFKEPITAFMERRDHILNYFDMPVTNAYTESINRLGKSINRMGRGYSLEVVRAKMLYDQRAIKKGALVVREQPNVPDDDALSMGYFTGYQGPVRVIASTRTLYYGAHIPTLCDLLDDGVFD